MRIRASISGLQFQIKPGTELIESVFFDCTAVDNKGVSHGVYLDTSGGYLAKLMITGWGQVAVTVEHYVGPMQSLLKKYPDGNAPRRYQIGDSDRWVENFDDVFRTAQSAYEAYLGEVERIENEALARGTAETMMQQMEQEASFSGRIRIAQVAPGGKEEQEALAGHDYDPSWDYDIDENPDESARKAYEQAASDIRMKHMKVFQDAFSGFRVSYVRGLEGYLGKYVDGTSSYPVIVVDLQNASESGKNPGLRRSWGRNTLYNIAVTTLMHELRHAWQEANGEIGDEDDAETFASHFVKSSVGRRGVYAGDVGGWLSEGYNEAAREVLGDFFRNPKGKQPWSVVPSSRLKKILRDYSSTGVVHDEAGLDSIAQQMCRNVFRLQVNTELAGHTQIAPEEIAEGEGFNWTKRMDDLFGNYILGSNGHWRISDYGLEHLFDDAIKLSQASTAGEKILIIDHMLNIVHQRGDLAALFVEGGRASLDDLFESASEKKKIEDLKQNKGTRAAASSSPDSSHHYRGEAIEGYRLPPEVKQSIKDFAKACYEPDSPLLGYAAERHDIRKDRGLAQDQETKRGAIEECNEKYLPVVKKLLLEKIPMIPAGSDLLDRVAAHLIMMAGNNPTMSGYDIETAVDHDMRGFTKGFYDIMDDVFSSRRGWYRRAMDDDSEDFMEGAVKEGLENYRFEEAKNTILSDISRHGVSLAQSEEKWLYHALKEYSSSHGGAIDFNAVDNMASAIVLGKYRGFPADIMWDQFKADGSVWNECSMCLLKLIRMGSINDSSSMSLAAGIYDKALRPVEKSFSPDMMADLISADMKFESGK